MKTAKYYIDQIDKLMGLQYLDVRHTAIITVE